ncbi:MAG: hypothetical protein M1830_003916 [Pleopsidium flavum]|nr:MAG: hypothetical protein M1830_003916 [Pleopsidium flavum]
MFKTIITIEVGPEKRAFPIHKELLCSQSDFFSAAFNPTHAFQESLKGTLHLPEDRPDTFEYLVQYLYTKSLAHEDVDAQIPAYHTLLRLYALADKLSIPALKNAIVDRMAAIADEKNVVPAPNDTHILYDEIRESAPVRKLVLDLFRYKKTKQLILTHEDSWDERFLRDLVVVSRGEGRVEGKKPWKKGGCVYHEHPEGTVHGCQLHEKWVLWT